MTAAQANTIIAQEEIINGVKSKIELMKEEIDKLSTFINSPSTVVCTHAMCDACKEALAAETLEKDMARLKLDALAKLYEDLKLYGIN